MKIMQRFLLLLGIIFLMTYCVILISKELDKNYVEKWETAYIERFISKMCRNEYLSWEEFLLFHNGLSYGGDTIEIRIDEYRKEQGLDRTFYYSPVLWSEVREHLWEEGSYRFEEGSIIRLVVRWLETGKEKENP